MKKIYLALFVIFQIVITSVNAQVLTPTKDGKRPDKGNTKTGSLIINQPNGAFPISKPERCGFSYMMKKAKAKGFDETAFEAEVSRLIQKKIADGERFTGPVTLPVIFHVIYRNADVLGNNSANLNTTKFQAQVNQLNIDYGNLAGSTWGVAANVQIQFCMALVDTAGRPLATAGIDRVNGQTKGWANLDPVADGEAVVGYIDGVIKPATIWDPYSYLNVWTVAMSGSGLLGYATYPSLSTLAGLDDPDGIESNSTAGVVLAWETVGSVANPGYDPEFGLGHTLTHELGHYFGLRHIWGDDVCGEDYCADTPPQDDATSGCPMVGTLNNCIPSGPKMFQNYMDYSDDACMNTFTANQATRCQTVMDNSPRRLSLINSKACVARPGNAISFIYAGEYSALETGSAGTCPNTKSYAFRIYPSVQATGAATVTFTVNGSSTATVNKDFIISTPTVSFVNGETTAKTLIISITDDEMSEPTEKIVIGYSIAGSGVVAGPDKQTVTLNIIDDDIATVTIDNTTPIKTLISQDFNSGTSIPAGWTTEVYDDGFGGYTPNQWVVSANGGTGTTGNAAHITSNTTTKPNTYNNSNTSDAYLFTPLIDGTALKNLNLTFKWKSNGEVGYDEGYIGYIPEGQAVTASNVIYFNAALSGQSAITTSSLNFSPLFNGTKFYFVFNWYNDNTIGSNPPFTIDDVVFTGKAFAISTTADADTAFPLYNGQNSYYYSTNSVAPNENRIIASINNLNADIGCITATMPGTGNGQTVVTTNTGAYTRSNKVINLTPAATNSTAAYQVTLYYTTAELAVWGANVPNLKMLKVKDGVSLSSTLTGAEAQVYSTVVDDQRATKGYASFTSNVTGGFSQFMLADPAIVIPVSLLSFEARGNIKNIVLDWSTATEINNKGFVIERSINGRDFEKIGWIEGKLNSNVLTKYQYYDHFVQPNLIYHYRLRQTDIDSREKLSEIRQAKIKGSEIEVSISPNPAKDQVKIFVSGSYGLTDLNLVNTAGQLIRSWKQVNTGSTPVNLDITGLSSGMYILQILTPQSTKVEKLIIK